MPTNIPDAALPHSPDEGVMEGEGYYESHSQPQHNAMSFGIPLFIRAVDEVPLPDSTDVLVIADFGVAGGHNSMEPMRTAIAGLRRRSAAIFPIAVVHTDQPTNDFDPLFTLLASPGSYLVGVSNVFAYVAGKSFYERIFPDAQILIGWSAIAVHWLSRVPALIPNQIWSNFATGEVKSAFAHQSRMDWETFLEHRAHELKPGGRLVVLGGASDEQGKSDAESLMNMANAALQELVAAGTLNQDEYARMVIPTYNRTPDEFKAPFAQGQAPGGLVLESAELVILDDPYWNAFQQNHNTAAFAAAYADFFHAAYGPSLFGALDPERTPVAVQQIEQEFYARLRDKISADPADAVTHWRVEQMLIARESTS